MKIMKKFINVLLALFLYLGASGAQADETAFPKPWQINLPDSASVVKEQITEFHDLLLIIIFGISIFVFLLLIYASIRFHHKNNKTPSKVSHNVLLEIIWTSVPVLILVVIAVPSFKLLYFAEQIPDPEMTIKATGYQWYWGYEYPDHGGFYFDSYMILDEDLKPGQRRLLETTNPVVVPVDTVVRVYVTGNDVIHSWAVPEFGVKQDAIPGRLNETWFKATKEGTYYGQCSEICGTGHAFMPITIKVVSKDAFARWVERAKVEFADGSDFDSNSHNEKIATALTALQ